MLIDLTNSGYVNLDVSTRRCKVTPKMNRHLEARRGNSDFDVLAFYSNPYQSATNATLRLDNRKLELEGVSGVRVSDAQDVLIFPRGGRVDIEENRNFVFDGVVSAGKFELVGRHFEFDYDAFDIKIPSAESLVIQTEVEGQFDMRGDPIMQPVRSRIEEVSGTLAIDHPSNRSGWKSDEFTNYPILTSNQTSHVYYDSESICQGAYHQDQFKYALEPFVIDSLDNFSRENLIFEGELIAGGVVPDMRESLRLMDDFSLGFERDVPENGLPLYNGLATLEGTLSLDLGGLHGPGVVEFLTSRMVGENNVYAPDSTYGVTTSYRNSSIEQDVPAVEAERAKFALRSNDERLFVRSIPKSPLRFFNEDVNLKGELMLVDMYMSAKGTFEFEGAQLASNAFELQERSLDSEHASFSLNSRGLPDMAFGTEDVAAHVDFDARRADFFAFWGDAHRPASIEVPMPDGRIFMVHG